MESIRSLLKIGVGPSSSHTYGPKKAAMAILEKHPKGCFFDVYLYGSLSLTGKGHLTDAILLQTLPEGLAKIHFLDESLPKHPNAMKFVVQDGTQFEYIIYSVGGGTILFEGEALSDSDIVYPHASMDAITAYMEKEKISFYEYVLKYEDKHIIQYLEDVVDTLFQSVHDGLQDSGVLPGSLKLKKVAKDLYNSALNEADIGEKERLFISSYAYAVSEQNAGGNPIVTTPTCGASGILPAVLYYCVENKHISREIIVESLAVAGLFGNVIKKNATISGAQGGCQAEVGSACAMAAAAYAYILGLNNAAIEYAAEMGLEHNLGLTCDPVEGYVQIPCIERNSFGALRAIDAAMHAKRLGHLRDNKISFDAVVRVMNETGNDLHARYKETSLGGLALEYDRKKN